MQGLSRLRGEDRDRPVFTRYMVKDGLPNDVIYGILEDSHGSLWISTNYGISRFDPENETFKNFDTRDGLHGNEFNTGAFCRTTEGTFIFGGVNGATEFHPDSLSESTFNAPVVLTGFNIFDKPAKFERSISGTEEITLSYKDNYFSFEFASLDYSKPDRNCFEYILEGLDREWTQAGTRHFAGYTHVDPGKYVFRVRGTNGDGIWSDQIASVRIIVTPPFWKTWWFIILAIITATATVAGFITYRVRQLLAIERLRSKIAADLHDDIGAGLTEISIMGEVITRKLPSDSKDLVTSEIDRIGSTSRHLIDSMSDIVWLVNPRRDSLFDLISRLGDSFKETLHAEDINFSIQNLHSLKNVRLSMEYRQNLFLIFKEALNNSLKYSGASDISLSVSLSGRRLVMELVDDGRGFDIDTDQNGNGLRNMEQRAVLLRGTLTIKSARGSGTTVMFTGNIT
jgi:two-component sensor histidine kinase